MLHLADGERSVATVAQEVSRQTGLKIGVQDCRRERTVGAWLDGATAGEALQSIALLNDWDWKHTASGHYALLRKPPIRPTTPERMRAAIVASLPRDIRDFAGLGEKLAVEPRMPQHDPGRFSPLAQNLKARLLDSLRESRALTADRLPYKKLNAEQQRLLITALVLDALEGAQDLVSDWVATRFMDPEKATIHVDEHGLLLVETVYPNGAKGGFGRNVKHRPPGP